MLRDPKRPNRLRLRPEPERQPAEVRSAEGQRLDDASAEFRSAWQTKADRKRRQARIADDLAFVFTQLLVVMVCFGAVGGGFLGYLARFGLSIIMMLVLACALLGFTLALTTTVLARRYAQLRRGEAERLEREARDAVRF